MRINIDDIQKVTVEIGEYTYDVAEKTASLCEKLNAIIDNANRNNAGVISVDDMFRYMEYVLGKKAVNEIFPKKMEENYDRIMLVYYGVSDAFNYNTSRINDDRRAREMRPAMDLINNMSESVKPISELNRQQRRTSGKRQ